METKTALPATLEDMIFEGRNKAYGAYLLRKLYHRHLTQAILLAITGFAISTSLPMLINKFLEKDGVTPVVKQDKKVIDMVLPPKVEEEIMQLAEPEAASQPITTTRDTTPKVTEDALVEQEEIPTRAQIAASTAGVTTTEGIGQSTIDNPILGKGSGKGEEGEDGIGASAAAAPTIFVSVEQMPEFEGGMKKLLDFVGRNIRYPKAAQAQGIEGTVVMSFVIATNGEITDITVLKGLGYGTEEEATRVLQKMPRWKPGIQNGVAVPVRMTLPIRLEMK